MANANNIKESEGFRKIAEAERGIEAYFDQYIIPMMNSVEEDLSQKQAQELQQMQLYQSDGVLPCIAQKSGVWNSKTAEDYVKMCVDELAKDPKFAKDIQTLSAHWKEGAKSVPGNQYDATSKALGGDLAEGYVGMRLKEMIINRMIANNIPESSAEYIFKKAFESSLLSLGYDSSMSPLQEHINEQAEKRYNPTLTEKTAGRAIGATADAVLMGGRVSPKTVLKFLGFEYALDTVVAKGLSLLSDNGEKPLNIEQGINNRIFGTKAGAPTIQDARKAGREMDLYNTSDDMESLDKKLDNKIKVQDYAGITSRDGFMGVKWGQDTAPSWNHNIKENSGAQQKPAAPTAQDDAARRTGKYKDVPLVVPRGKEDEYLRENGINSDKATMETSSYVAQGKKEQAEEERLQEQQEEMEEEQEKNEQGKGKAAVAGAAVVGAAAAGTRKDNATGWESAASPGFGDVIRDLPNIIANFPNYLASLFSGDKLVKTAWDNKFPLLGLLIGGMFFKGNSPLKLLIMALCGGMLFKNIGANVMNERTVAPIRDNEEGNRLGQQAGNAAQNKAGYVQYKDEELNPRIQNPTLQGNCLIATIDKVPSTISLPPTVIDAYEKGALPINTLANHLLEKNDMMKQMAQENFDMSQNQSSTRSQGIR